MESMEFKLGELFSGPGGIALGALCARAKKDGILYSIKHAWANDFDEDTCQTYRENLCPDEPKTVVCQDVKELDFNKLSKINALAFGFPCNDFSMVGQQKGTDGVYGPLYSYGVEALKKFEPDWFLAENVGGLRSSNEGKAFTQILEDLFQAGYNITPHLYKFENYGVPQARHRIIIIGIRKDLNKIFEVPEITHLIPVSSREAIEIPPIPKNATNNERTNQSLTVIERLKTIKAGKNAFAAEVPVHLQLNVRALKLSHIYRRLDPDKPSYTVTGSGGGGTHVYHWSENRALTNRERARLQTFPDNFNFCGSKESVRKQIGMAVPPRAAEVILTSVLKTIAGIKYKSRPSNMVTRIHGEAFLNKKGQLELV